MAELTDDGATALPGTPLPWSAVGDFWQDRLRLAGEWNSELLRFALQRWTKDCDTVVQLASCRSAAEILCVHFEVMADAASDYLGEAQQWFAGLNAALLPCADATRHARAG